MTVAKGQFNKFPIVGCSGGRKDKYGVYKHFCLRHTAANIQIEGDGIQPKYELCGMKTKNVERHKESTTCLKARRRRANKVRHDLQAEAGKVELRVCNCYDSVERIFSLSLLTFPLLIIVGSIKI